MRGRWQALIRVSPGGGLLMPFLLLLLLLAPTGPGGAAFLGEGSSTNYQTLERALDQYIKTLQSARGSGRTQLRRILQFYANRLESGWLPNPAVLNRLAIRQLDGLPRVPGATWTSLGPTETRAAKVSPANALSLAPGMGRLNFIELDHQTGTIYAGSASGGLWSSDDEGESWKPLTDAVGLTVVSDMAIDPRDSKHLFLLTGDGEGFLLPSSGVVVTNDGGGTWTDTGLRFSSSELIWGYRLMINPTSPDTLLVATSQHIHRSTDGGKTWTAVADGVFRDMKFHPTNPSIIYASTTTQVLRSADGGRTWLLVAGMISPLPDPVPSTRVALAVSPASPDVVYAVAGGPNGFAGLSRSDDAGQSFVLRSISPNILGASPLGADNLSHAWYDLTVAVDPTNADRVYVGGINIWASADGGRNWTLSAYWQEALSAHYPYVHPDIHRLVMERGRVYAATDGGLWILGGSNPTWTARNKGLTITEVFNVCAGPGSSGKIMYGAQDNGTNVLMGELAAEVWGGDGTICQIDPSSKSQDDVYMASQFGNIYFSSNGGAVFTPAWPNYPALPPAGAYVTPYQLHPQLSQFVYACYADVFLGQRSSSGWGSVFKWSQLTAGALGEVPCSAMKVAPSDAQIVYVAKPNALFRGVGLSWQEVTWPWSSHSVTITDVSVSGSNPDRVAITLSGYRSDAKVFFSSDGGNSWSNITGKLPNVAANAILFENGAKSGLYVGTDIGVFYRNNDMVDWALMGDKLPRVIVRSLIVQPGTNRLLAGTFGRGIFKTHLVDPPPEVMIVEKD
jgi:photosystem II stability/assembly factor-like uncharacterized protein